MNLLHIVYQVPIPCSKRKLMVKLMDKCYSPSDSGI